MRRENDRNKQYRYVSRDSTGLILILLLMIISFLPQSASAVKIPVSDDTFINLRLLFQPWVAMSYDPEPGEGIRKFSTDFYVRRTRIILAGQMTKWVSFFVETDTPNWGKGNSWTTPEFFVQDGYVSFDLHESIHIAVGMLLVPFVHQSLQGATSLHTLDYHSALIKYPLNSNKVWRDFGLMFYGLLFNKKLDYRISVTDGVGHGDIVVKPKNENDPGVKSNTKDSPRITGRVAYNMFDAEEGFFLGGTYLGAKKVLSLGVAFDIQPGVYGDSNAYYGVGGDIFADIPLGSNRLSGQLDVLYYGGSNNPSRGIGMLFDVGYAIGKWEPLIAIDWFKGSEANKFKDHFLGVHAGMNWWFQGHGMNIKLDLGLVKAAGREMEDLATVGTIQTQLLF